MWSVSALLEIFIVWFQLLTFITLTGLLVSSSNLCTLLASSFVCVIIAFPAHVGRVLSTMTVVGPLISIIELLMERFTMVDPSLPDWSELPEDLLVEIISRVPLEDLVAASVVSKSWHSASCVISKSNSLKTSLQPPWLMGTETLLSKIRRFFSLFNCRVYKLELDEVNGRRCWGSPHGWLITMGPDFESCLVHILGKERISLPPLDRIRRLVAGREEWFRLVHRFIPFKERSLELSILVIAIFGPTKKLAFTRVAFNGGGGAALNRRGQGEWVIVTDQDNFNDVAYFQDQLYGSCGNGKLVRLVLDAHGAATVIDIAPRPDSGVRMPQQLYLIGSSENLFAVYRYRHDIPSKMRYETICFSVYKFDFSAPAYWEEVKDLKDLVVFVGDSKSWCIPASKIPGKSNCIYFTDSNWEWQRLPGVAYGGRDVGLFNMALQKVVQRRKFGEDNPSFYSRSIWITPAVHLDQFSLH